MSLVASRWGGTAQPEDRVEEEKAPGEVQDEHHEAACGLFVCLGVGPSSGGGGGCAQGHSSAWACGSRIHSSVPTSNLVTNFASPLSTPPASFQYIGPTPRRPTDDIILPSATQRKHESEYCSLHARTIASSQPSVGSAYLYVSLCCVRRPAGQGAILVLAGFQCQSLPRG